MSDTELLHTLLQRIEALEAREQALTAASNAYQAIITTLLGNMDKAARDKVISMIDQAHEIAYVRAAQRCHEPQKRKIKQAMMLHNVCLWSHRGREGHHSHVEL